MTDKIQQARRAAFEKWFMTTRMPNAPEDLWLKRDQFGYYLVNQVFSAWEGFNAALDCSVFEFPELERLGDPLTGSSISDIRAQNNYNIAVSKCRSAIESTNLGIKVK